MAYLDDESSVSDGAPVELYDFTGPTASYRYTSGAIAVTYSGNTYTPAAGLARAAIELPTTGNDAAGSLSLTLRASETLVRAYAYATPPRSLRLRVYRRQEVSGETALIWDGEVVAIDTRGAMATVRALSALSARMRRMIPGLAASWRCPYRLYDAYCQVVAADWDLATTVSSVASDGVTIVVASVGGQPDDWFAKGAELLRVSDGERRIVYRQVGTTLTINEPFPTLTAGDSVTLFAGCDHTHRFYTDFAGTPLVSGDCELKFSNSARFFGEPSLPGSNPFTLNIRHVIGS